MEDLEKRAEQAEKEIAKLTARLSALETGSNGPAISGDVKSLVEQLQRERDTAVAKANKLELENEKLRAGVTGVGKTPVKPLQPTSSHPLSHRLTVAELILAPKDVQLGFVGKKVAVAGWARTIRKQGGGRFTFIELNDGSTFGNIQVVVDQDRPGFDAINGPNAGTGAAIAATGVVVKSVGTEQLIELNADSVELLGPCVPADYPLAKKKMKIETLRSIAHLRPRTNTFGAMARVRNSCAFATHKFFQELGFFYCNTPLITASDCEGAGEMFQVTTLLKNGQAKLTDVPTLSDKKTVDYTQDFFGKPSFLTVSGQLNGEMYATALGKIYTFGPTFRAENSHTSRHIAEFWMIEPEIAFADLNDNMDYAEAYLKYVIQYVLENNAADMKFFDQWVEKGVIERLKHVLETPFKRLTYTEAVDLLLEAVKKGKKFDTKVEWGIDLQSEHERYVTEEIFKQPVILINYPKDIKAFYMKLNEDGKTVRAMDVLVPKIGEIIGGSQREERLEVLEQRIEELKLDKEAYKYYLDLRRYGSVVHSGFGLGFERLVMFVTGLENIRDAIPFPRYPGHAEF